MSTTRAARIENCVHCGLALPLRLPYPGEAASAWKCSYCSARFHAVLVDDCPPDMLDNVLPERDLNPRTVIGGEVLATMHKRSGHGGRVFDERRVARVAANDAMTVFVEGEAHAVKSLDLSAGGFGFVCSRAVDEGRLITARFDALPGVPDAHGIVRSCVSLSPNRFRVGVEFAPQAAEVGIPSDCSD